MSEQRLSGVRVLVTRPRERAEELCFLLEDEGAEVVALPLLELLPPEDPRPLLAAAESIHRYEWVVFASPQAVDSLLDAVRQAGTLHHLRRALIACVGPRTAARAKAGGLDVNIEGEAGGHELAHDLAPRIAPDSEVLIPAAEQGREEIFRVLSVVRARVTRVVAYRAEEARPPPEAVAALQENPPRVGLFASPRTVQAYLDAVDETARSRLGEMKYVAIGRTTAAALEEAGLKVAAVATTPSAEGLVEAAITALQPLPDAP